MSFFIERDRKTGMMDVFTEAERCPATTGAGLYQCMRRVGHEGQCRVRDVVLEWDVPLETRSQAAS